jgi:hypothetical protein
MATCFDRRLSFPEGELFKAGGCFNKYACAQGTSLPEGGHTLSPWVRCVFSDGDGHLITVGNQSSPEINNTAVIKSFDFGMSDGLHCKIVIHDQQGSAFDIFVKNLVRDFSKLNTNEGFRMQAQWGWAKAGCPVATGASASCIHYLHVDSIESNFVAGKFIHEITAIDLVAKVFEGGVEKHYGSDDQNISLKDALRKLFTDDPPPKISKVKFLRFENKQLVEYKFGGSDDEEGNGPKGKYHGRGRNKLEVGMSWIKTTTDRGLGVKPVFDSLGKDPTIIFLEDPRPNCNQIKNWDSNCIGTYVVNSGKSSSVLEFNPRIRWDFSRLMNVGGNVPTNTIQDTKQQKMTGPDGCPELARTKNPGAGQVATISAGENEKNRLGKQASSSVSKAQAAQARTMRLIPDAIEADLVIIGNPVLPSVGEGLTAMNVSIVFINPFNLMPNGGSRCGDWTLGINNVCNPILSNKAWFITRCNHHIQEGVYTTTLGISLAAPGIDIEPGANLGGSAEGANEGA